MNLRLNPLQRVALFALRAKPWSSPQQLAVELGISPRQAGAVTKQLHMAECASLRQDKQILGDGLQRRTKIVRTYRLTAKGRRLAIKVTPEEVTKFTKTRHGRKTPVAATTSKGEASTRLPGRQYTKNNQLIITSEEIMANAQARFKPGEWF